MVAGFIALVKVAVTSVFGEGPCGTGRRRHDTTVGGVRPGFPPVSSGSLHPVATTSSRNAVKQIACVLYLLMAITLLVRCNAETQPMSRSAIG